MGKGVSAPVSQPIRSLIIHPHPACIGSFFEHAVGKGTRVPVSQPKILNSLKSLNKKLLNLDNSYVNEALLELPFATHNLTYLLLLCGDIEVNPGPLIGQNSVQDNNREAQLQVISYNVRGLANEKKYRHLINHFNRTLGNKNVDVIIGLQETMIQDPLKIPFLWRGNLHLTPGTGNGRGCLMLVSNHLNVIAKRDIADRGHVLALQKQGEQKTSYIIANIYAPNAHNADKISFFEEVIDTILEFEERFDCNNVLMIGDFNLIFKDREKDNRSFSGNEKRIASTIARLLGEIDLRDAWNGQVAFTWRRANSNTFSMLDRVMYRSGVLEKLSIQTNWSVSSSDHAAVEASFKLIGSSRPPKRANIPRLDPCLLKNPETALEIRREFDEMFATCGTTWDPHLKLEFAKMCLRTVVEKAQALRNKRERDDEDGVNESLNKLVDRLSKLREDEGEEKQEIIVLIEALRGRKELLIEEKGKRLADRLATKWYNEGEKSTKYFMRLLNRRAPDKLDVLIDDDGREITDKVEINQAIINFYKELYEDYDHSLIEEADSDEAFFENLRSCSQDENLSVSAPITQPELHEVLKTCQDSAPGPDGISYSYISYFWDVLGPLLVEVWNHSLRTGKLAPSHKLSFLRLIPKQDKDSRKLTNWRPITLSNCDHKLITKLYSKRLVAAVGRLIDGRQTAYIKGRMINDNLRTLIASLEAAKEEDDIDGLVISLDAKKAFDSVEHSYIRKILNKFGFSSFIPVFDILYKDLRSDIIVNGTILNGYKINRGVKQGDALSCILFIMCMEPLICNIEKNQEIEPIFSNQLQAALPKALAYADDVTCVVRNNGNGIKCVFHEYERLTKLSGLQLNADKTDFLLIQSRAVRPINQLVKFKYLDSEFENEAKPEIKINGLFFQADLERMKDRNVSNVITKMEAHLWKWSKRGLSTLGKILILKTFGISQLIYLFQSLVLTVSDFKKLNAILYKFIWNRHFGAPKAPDRIKREIINTSIDLGGFGMIDIQALDRSLKLKMLARLTTTPHPFLAMIRRKINLNEFFFPVSNQMMDKPIAQAVSFLAADRLRLLSLESVTSDRKIVSLIREIRIRDILTNAGIASLHFFQLRRAGKVKLRDLSLGDFGTIRRLVKNQNYVNVLLTCVTLNVPHPDDQDKLTYWYKGLKPLDKLSARDFRQAGSESIPICVYKLGAILSPKDNASWTYKLRKLTITRHKNLILKLAHGDWYTKDRLFRFGLIDSPNCDECGQLETIRHKILECPNKCRVWQALARLHNVDLQGMAEPIEYVLGMHKHTQLSHLAIHAEILNILLYNQTTLPPDRLIEIVRNKLNRVDYKNKNKF